MREGASSNSLERRLSISSDSAIVGSLIADVSADALRKGREKAAR